MAFLLIDDVLHHLTPGLGHQAALLLTVGLTDLARLGFTLLVSVGLTVRGEHSLTLGLAHHLAVPLVDSAALLLVHSPTLRLTDPLAGLLVHCGAGWLPHCLTDLLRHRGAHRGGGLSAVLFSHRGAFLPVYDGAHLGVHSVTDRLALGLVEAPVVLPVLGRHLHQLAAISDRPVRYGRDDSRHHQPSQ